MCETNLARLRKQAGLSQAQLAIKANVARRYIANIEQGQRSIGGISLRIAACLASALDVCIEDLLDDNVYDKGDK